MEKIVAKLLIYGDLPEDSILMELSRVSRDLHSNNYSKEDLISRCFKQVKRLLELATECAFDNNLWQSYLTYLLIMDENPFSLTCEKVGSREGSVNHFATSDFHAFRELFNYDFSEIENTLEIDCFSCITNYKAIEKPELMYNKNVSEKVGFLAGNLRKADSDEAFFKGVTEFYKKIGVGAFGLNKAFRLREQSDGKIEFVPINNMDRVVLDDLVGYEIQKQKLIANTRAFVEGKKANNVLLFGDSGTGKSTSIKAIVNEFYGDGLRMIEIYKYQFRQLSQLISQIKNRNYKFIIYMDDLSFEEDESDYKFLKAVIEGGVETKPDNILIYATSNRRHLIRETWNDRRDVEQDGDIHRSDTMEEKLSLANRFGVTIGYYKPSRQEYYTIVKELADRSGIDITNEELCLEADRWELNHGGVSGRTAQQFINHLLGK
ncbi:ATP-binding protein [Butyrivibrio sp. X503]|uniref:ATP-binding protein n=1 Tax=Butyrivibrio sp. X503 TaxID=2364878 RepID=UPI000EA9F144|nr:ATP-binding protein [Butyrivibrio sp. X503]RKM53980.1 ATP-binding protein [Butyrivibrio sp. X503]